MLLAGALDANQRHRSGSDRNVCESKCAHRESGNFPVQWRLREAEGETRGSRVLEGCYTNRFLGIKLVRDE